jgi:hypothetical protein
MIRTTEKFIKRGAILAHEEGKKASVFDPIIHGLGALFKALVLKGGASKKHEVEVVDAYQLKVSPCMICQLTDAFPDHISPRLLLVTD